MNQLFNIPPGKFAGEGYQQYAEPSSKKRQRNGFVTFWLWLGIIGSLISGVVNFISISSISLGGYESALIEAGYGSAVSAFDEGCKIILFSAIVGCVCTVIGYFMILGWHKAGFWLLIVASIVLSCINLYAIGHISGAMNELGVSYDISTMVLSMVAGSFIGWIVLWAILQIKKNGKSCWSQLR